MKKSFFLILKEFPILLICAMLSAGCGAGEEATAPVVGSEGAAASVLGDGGATEPVIGDGDAIVPAGEGGEAEQETVAAQESLEEWAGYYRCWGSMTTGIHISADLWIYEEKGQYYGYLVADCWKSEGEGAFQHQINGVLAKIHAQEDSVEACFLEEFPGKPGQESLFTSYENGEKMFALRGGREALQTEWAASELSGEDMNGFTPWEHALSAAVENEEQAGQFLRAEGISAEEKPWFWFDDESGTRRLNFWFDPEEEKGTGIFYTFYPGVNDENYIAGFSMDSGDIVQRVWENRTDAVTKEGEEAYMPDEAVEIWEYDEAGRPVSYLLEGSDPWKEEPEQLKIIEITYTYRADGTLAEKACWYNHRAFGTTRMSETSVYDSQERILYTRSYITHGYLEDYYIYEGDAMEPSYCLILDHQGPDAWVSCFVEYVEDIGGASAAGD